MAYHSRLFPDPGERAIALRLPLTGLNIHIPASLPSDGPKDISGRRGDNGDRSTLLLPSAVLRSAGSVRKHVGADLPTDGAGSAVVAAGGGSVERGLVGESGRKRLGQVKTP